MKNYIPATFLLTLIVVGVLMGLYFLPSMSVGGKPLRKVDLLANLSFCWLISVRMWKKKYVIPTPLSFLLL